MSRKKGQKKVLYVRIPAFSSIPPHDCLAQTDTAMQESEQSRRIVEADNASMITLISPLNLACKSGPDHLLAKGPRKFQTAARAITSDSRICQHVLDSAYRAHAKDLREPY
jgi:hypothetical protein